MCAGDWRCGSEESTSRARGHKASTCGAGCARVDRSRGCGLRVTLETQRRLVGSQGWSGANAACQGVERSRRLAARSLWRRFVVLPLSSTKRQLQLSSRFWDSRVCHRSSSLSTGRHTRVHAGWIQGSIAHCVRSQKVRTHARRQGGTARGSFDCQRNIIRRRWGSQQVEWVLCQGVESWLRDCGGRQVKAFSGWEFASFGGWRGCGVGVRQARHVMSMKCWSGSKRDCI